MPDSAARPGEDRSRRDAAATSPPMLSVEGLKTHFPVRKGMLSRIAGYVYAVDGVSFSIREGETLGLVGESGCGKSTVGKTILKLIEPTAGRVRVAGHDITDLGPRELRPYRRAMQIIFQDPYSSLNPRMSAGSIVGQPFIIHERASGRDCEERVAELFERVGLRADQMRSYPHEFSGGQRQRIGIARALALNTKLIIGDEPVSALDVSIQAQVINLLMDLQEERGLSYLFISHDLAVVEHISHRIAVMYLGKLVELSDKQDLPQSPAPLHRGAAVRRTRSRPRHERKEAHRAGRRRAEPDRSSRRVPVSHPVPLRRASLPHRGAGLAGGAPAALGRLPPAVNTATHGPARRRGRTCASTG